MPKISPCLWFDGQAEEAARFYVSIFPNSRITKISHYLEEGPGEPGSVMLVLYELDGQEYMALNGGPDFKFNEAISLSIDCKSQKDVDHYWAKLTDGGEEGPCGWVKDRYGVSWQVAPAALNDMLDDPDKKKAGRAMQAMLKMKKLDIPTLQKAFEGK